MILSIAYYPEYHKKEEWDRDFSLIKEAGFTAVRIGEFAWSQLQKSENHYDFSILDSGIEAAKKHGLAVILCTPTACPPIWLCEKYPEIFPMDIDGRRSMFGARQHRCYNFAPYLKASAKIVKALAEHFADNDNVIGWQIDNELGGEQKKCYCDNCKSAFQKYLMENYESIDDLNERWGNHFWSQDYQDFKQISTPKHFAMDLYIWQNPALNLDFIRFSSQSIVNFCHMQAQIISEYTKKPITTNTDTFYYGDTVDLYKLFKPLYASAMDCYTNDEYIFAFYCDFMRACNDEHKFWILENGDGGKNMLRCLQIAQERGCEVFSIFKFRPFPWGQEQSRTALVDLYGRKSPNFETIKSYTKNANEVRSFSPKTALLYDFDCSWAYNAKSLMIDPKDGLKYPQYIVNTIYKALFEAGIDVDIVNKASSLSGYDRVILPLCIIFDEAFEDKLFEFVKGGGHLICDTELFLKNKDNAYLEKIPKIYKEIFLCNPLTDDDLTRPYTVDYGQGNATMIKSNFSIDSFAYLVQNSQREELN